ncbi:MAG TPA: DUF3788 domain-containing protein [Saprospiraceae bacterium]|nr:DUF3788 domain-containing protein [Saprospiraceae bacterium]
MAYERLSDKSIQPTYDDIKNWVGETVDLWETIHDFISQNYDFNRELAFFSKNYGWTVRYRKAKKTLASFFPERSAFSVLLVLGKDEAEKVDQIRSELDKDFLTVFDLTEQLHDGRWLWLRILTRDNLDSLIKVLMIKRKPKRTPRHNT